MSAEASGFLGSGFVYALSLLLVGRLTNQGHTNQDIRTKSCIDSQGGHNFNLTTPPMAEIMAEIALGVLSPQVKSQTWRIAAMLVTAFYLVYLIGSVYLYLSRVHGGGPDGASAHTWLAEDIDMGR